MLIIDRFEGKFAVIEDGDSHFEIERSLLPDNACEGDILVKNNEHYQIDENAAEERRKKIIDLQKDLWS